VLSSGLALLLGVAMSLAVPMPSSAAEAPSASELWRAYPLQTRAHDAVSGGTAGDQLPDSVPMGTSGEVQYEGAGPDVAADIRLILQLGMLIALLYVAFLCVWFATTRQLRTVGAGRGLRHALQRVRGSRVAAVAKSDPLPRGRSVAQRPNSTLARPSSLWSCEIAWQPGQVRSRFQAVMSPPNSRARRVVAESEGLRWPPRDVRKLPTRELEAALGRLVASIVAAGWEPVQSGGAWSERRFVWRQEGKPPTTLELSRSRPSLSPVRSWRSRGDAGRSPATPTRRRAPHSADREAVLRVVAERPGVMTRELAAASGVKGDTLSALLRTLTERGELEQRPLPDGQTGYTLPASAASGEPPPAEPGASTDPDRLLGRHPRR
jgi:hypothetical protein